MGLEAAKFRLAIKVKSLSSFKVVNFVGSMWFIPILFTLGVSKAPLVGGYTVGVTGDQG